MKMVSLRTFLYRLVSLFIQKDLPSLEDLACSTRLAHENTCLFGSGVSHSSQFLAVVNASQPHSKAVR